MPSLQFETPLQAAARQAFYYLDALVFSARARLIADDLRKALIEEGALTSQEAGPKQVSD